MAELDIALREIADDIATLRKLHSVQAISEACGVSIQTVYAWFRGDHLPRADAYKVIVKMIS